MPSPRVISICIFRNGSHILVARGYDEQKAEYFLRPVGGAVEFGELAAEAIEREVCEELGVEIEQIKRLAVLENRFTYDGQPGHEIVFVFDATFVDRSLYQAPELPIREDVWIGPATWIDLESNRDEPLYPTGLFELLTRST